MEGMTQATSRTPEGIDSQDGKILATTSTDNNPLSIPGTHISRLGTATDTADSSSVNRITNCEKTHDDLNNDTYNPWDMPPIIHPASSNPETRGNTGLKGFSSLNSTWPHFRSKPHPTISVPVASTPNSRSNFDMAAPSTPPRNSTYSNPEDPDNAMCTPTFGSSTSNYSRRNSSVSVMALDTPPPLSLMDMESSSGSNFGSGVLHSLGNNGPMARSLDSGLNNSFPFPVFGMRYDPSIGYSRRSSRANSISMEPRHVRKPSEDTNMSDGGNNSGSERSRRHSPAVVPFERSVRRSALLPKPKSLLKVFTQLEEEIHHNKHEYNHERETTQVRRAGDEHDVSLMEENESTPLPLMSLSQFSLGNTRRQSMSRLNPELELNDFQKQQGEYKKLYQLQLQHLAQHQHQRQQDDSHTHPHPLQVLSPMQESSDHENNGNPSYTTPMTSTPSSPLQAPILTKSKRKSSTCEERFDPYHSTHLKRRAVSPSIGPMVSHRRSPSSSPARHLTGHSRSKITALPSPSGTGSFFRYGHGLLGSGTINPTSGVIGNDILEGGGTNSHDMNIISRNDSNINSINMNNGGTNAPNISSPLNVQHTSRSFSELSLGIPKSTH
ncbi:hypothetical protein BGZ76_007176 [Entomortierella beljakovae]|nr:hypothetical protein BGZ76_007176 [Entomortierella beljakovae]